MNEELEIIVQNMIGAGESEENIALVIRSYTTKEAKTANQTAEAPTVEDTKLVSEDVSLDEKPKREYLIDNVNVDKAELENKLNDTNFVKGVKNGSINIDIKNDKKLEELAKKQFNLITKPIEESRTVGVEFNPVKETKAKNFDKGIFKMAEREAYDKYKLTGEIDLSLIPEKDKRPGFIEDKLAKLARGTISTVKGFEQFKDIL